MNILLRKVCAGIVWRKRDIKIRWYGYPIYICEYQATGLTNAGANGFIGHKNNYRGYCYQIKE